MAVTTEIVVFRVPVSVPRIEEAAVFLSFIHVYWSPKSQPSVIDSPPTCFGHSRPSSKGFCKYTPGKLTL